MKYLKVFTDFLEVTGSLSDAGLGRLFRAMLRYAQDGAEPALKGKEGVAWAVARQHIDRETAAYANKVEARREAGRKSGQSRRDALLNSEQNEQTGTKANKTNQDKDKDKEKEKEKDKDKESVYGASAAPPALAGPPTLEEITAYCEARGNQVNPQRFLDFYTSNGWRIGKNPMKDWKAAVRSWESNGMDQRQETPKKPISYLDGFKKAMELASLEEAKRI